MKSLGAIMKISKERFKSNREAQGYKRLIDEFNYDQIEFLNLLEKADLM